MTAEVQVAQQGAPRNERGREIVASILRVLVPILLALVVGGIIPPADEAALLEAGVARVYTPKDFEVSRIMGDIVDLVAAHHGVVAISSRS